MSLVPPEIVSISNTVHTKLGLSAQIECHVESEPVATVHWFHHGLPLQLNGRIGRVDTPILTKSDEEAFHTTKHVLNIKSVRESDLGVYECRAENKLGFKGTAIELTGRPMPPIFKKSPLLSQYMTYNLIWQTESLTPIIEYKLKFRQIPSGNITPHNRHFPSHWNELIVPAEFSDGKLITISS